MNWLETFLIGVALSMDALAVSLALGAAENRKLNWGKILLTALFFGGFQALMPLAGWFGGMQIGSVIQNWGRFIAAGLLGLIGGKMIRDRNQEQKIVFGLKELLLLAIATSIDAFLVGISFACLGRNSILPEILLIGITTFVLSAAGCIAGKHSRHLLGRHGALAGGLMLILIGLKILFFG